MPPRLTMTAVTKSFGATRALRGVDLAVDAGQVLGLVGENGAGKSTLMKVLSGAHQPDAGSMTLDGEPYRPRHPLDARRAGVAMIYQELSLAPHLSVAENILLGVEPVRGPFVKWADMHAIARRALDQVGLAQLAPSTIVNTLPLAQRQLVEIARAVALDARVIVLDEPTSSLTRRDIERLFALVLQLKQRGLAVIYISHFLEEVRAVCDRYTVLRDGASVGSGNVAEASDAHIIAQMVGRQVEDLYPRNDHHPGESVLEVRDLAGVDKPRRATLTLHRGEVLGIAGLVGAGRTETLRAIFGLDKVAAGELRIGSYTGQHGPRARWRQGVGLVSEDRKGEGLALNLSIADNVTLPKQAHLVSPRGLLSDSKTWIDRLAIRCRSGAQPVQTLSGGNQQKVALARLLHAGVDVLLLDEPTRGIDVGSKAQIYTLIDELARQGKAVLMVSSYLPELLGVCDRIAVMCRGVLGEAKPVSAWTEHALIAAAIGQEAAA